jgi:hypothetical protein
MQFFWKDDKVQERVSFWGKKTGMDERVIHAAQALERLRELAGLEHRGELMHLDGEDLAIDNDKLEESDNATHEAMLALEGLPGEEEDTEWISKDAIAFVKELGLPYPWLAAELVDSFYIAATGAAWGVVFHRDFWYDAEAERWEGPVPPGKIELDLREGETWADVLERLSKILVDRGLPMPIPRGKIPGEGRQEKLEQWAYWFYLNRVKGVSINQIARDEFPIIENDDGSYLNLDRRSDVRRGITTVERLLGLTPYEFR